MFAIKRSRRASELARSSFTRPFFADLSGVIAEHGQAAVVWGVMVVPVVALQSI